MVKPVLAYSFHCKPAPDLAHLWRGTPIMHQWDKDSFLFFSSSVSRQLGMSLLL